MVGVGNPPEEFRPRRPAASVDAYVCTASEIIRAAFKHFEPCQVAVSFNGGKDAMAVLELVRMTVEPDIFRQLLFYVAEIDDEFPELAKFREEQVARLGIKLIRVPGTMQTVVNHLYDAYGMRAAVSGIRHDDDCWATQHVSDSEVDKGWRPVKNYLPILDWDNDAVWCFTMKYKVPYCVLYAQGYTSLGAQSKTKRNPCLEDASVEGGWRAAWELPSCATERAARETDGSTHETQRCKALNAQAASSRTTGGRESPSSNL
jgi:FAD synthetase